MHKKLHYPVEWHATAVQEDRNRQITELNVKSQKLTERLEQREQELLNNVEDLHTQLQVTLGLDAVDARPLWLFAEYWLLATCKLQQNELGTEK